MLTRSCAVSLFVVLGLCAGAITAAADDDGWGAVGCDQTPSPHCDIEAGSTSKQTAVPRPAHTPANHPGTDQTACVYQPSQFQGHPNAASWPPLTWYEGRCELAGVMITLAPAMTPGDVARLARGQLRLPRPEIGANPAGDQLVNLSTWLYLASGWQTESATASVPGISVTATATPTSVTWSMGDGTTVDCASPGVQYRRGADPRSKSPECGHTYRRSSGHTTFAVSATVRWSIAWSGGGETGTLPDLTTTGSSQFRVRESQALNVAPPTR